MRTTAAMRMKRRVKLRRRKPSAMLIGFERVENGPRLVLSEFCSEDTQRRRNVERCGGRVGLLFKSPLPPPLTSRGTKPKTLNSPARAASWSGQGHLSDTTTLVLKSSMAVVPHLMTLADLSGPQIHRAVNHAYHLKQLSTPWLAPQLRSTKQPHLRMPSQSLFNKSIALLFSKRSTRTRVAAETAAVLLGGRALFLGKEDIQLGVNESPRDTARVIGGMCQGIFARVGDHSEIEVCGIPVIHNFRTPTF